MYKYAYSVVCIFRINLLRVGRRYVRPTPDFIVIFYVHVALVLGSKRASPCCRFQILNLLNTCMDSLDSTYRVQLYTVIVRFVL